MSKDEQNLLFGVLVFVTAVVLGVAALTVINGDDANSTEAAGAGLMDPDPTAQPDGATTTAVTLAAPTGDSLAVDPAADPNQTDAPAPGQVDPAGDVAPAAPAPGSPTTSMPSTTAAPATAAPSSAAPASDPPATTASVVSTTTPSTVAPAPPSTTAALTTTSTAAPSPTSADPTTTAAPAPEGLNALELEIFRLTNQLRTDPNGPLAREKPVPDCGGNLRVDRATGVYEAIGALTLSEVASLQVARPWSAKLTRDLKHQDRAGAPALESAGLTVGWVGENVSYNNYPEPAMQHFVGWRESDGHFCNMMNPRYTHIGVGEHTAANGDSFATQNFFTVR